MNNDPQYFNNNSLESLDSLEYSKVRVRGRFEYEKELLMGPRSLYNYAEGEAHQGGGGLMSSQSSSHSGYHVVTPFKVEGQK